MSSVRIINADACNVCSVASSHDAASSSGAHAIDSSSASNEHAVTSEGLHSSDVADNADDTADHHLQSDEAHETEEGSSNNGTAAISSSSDALARGAISSAGSPPSISSRASKKLPSSGRKMIPTSKLRLSASGTKSEAGGRKEDEEEGQIDETGEKRFV